MDAIEKQARELLAKECMKLNRHLEAANIVRADTHVHDAAIKVICDVLRAGWVIADGKAARWRMWGEYGPAWTSDRSQALHFARRTDAEAFAKDDEDAWLIQPVGFLDALHREQSTEWGPMPDFFDQYPALTPPEGYVLVAVEPTEEEVRATNEAQQEFFDDNLQSQFFSSGHYMEESIRHALRSVRAARPEVQNVND